MSRRATQIAAIDAWNRGEREAWLAHFSEDAVWVAFNVIDGSEFRGHEGLVRLWENQHEQFRDYRVEVGAMTDVGEHGLLSELELAGVGGASGVEVRRTIHQIAWFRDGKLARVEMHGSREAALAALGDPGRAGSSRAGDDWRRGLTELIEEGIDAMNRRDAAALARLTSPEAEWRPALTAGGDLERPVYTGADGMVRYLADVDDLFSDVHFMLLEVEPLTPERVFVRLRVAARGRGSGVELEIPIWALYELRDGKLLRGRGFLSEDEAREHLASRSSDDEAV